jgi:hypothetical protein
VNPPLHLGEGPGVRIGDRNDSNQKDLRSPENVEVEANSELKKLVFETPFLFVF